MRYRQVSPREIASELAHALLAAQEKKKKKLFTDAALAVKRTVRIELSHGDKWVGYLQVYYGDGPSCIVGDSAQHPDVVPIVKRVLKGVEVVPDPPRAEITPKDAALALAPLLRRTHRNLETAIWKRPGDGRRIELKAKGEELGYVDITTGDSPVKNFSKLDPAKVDAAVQRAIGNARVSPPTDPEQRAKLLAAIAKSPDDDGPRGVYADWLMEQVDPNDRARGEFITVQLAGASGTKREHELLQLHGDVWAKGLRQARNQEWRYVRGMLDSISIHQGLVSMYMPRILEVEPVVRAVRLAGGGSPDLPKLAPLLASFEELDLRGQILSGADQKLLLGSKLPRLKVLRWKKCFDPKLAEAMKKKFPPPPR